MGEARDSGHTVGLESSIVGGGGQEVRKQPLALRDGPCSHLACTGGPAGASLAQPRVGAWACSRWGLSGFVLGAGGAAAGRALVQAAAPRLELEPCRRCPRRTACTP